MALPMGGELVGSGKGEAMPPHTPMPPQILMPELVGDLYLPWVGWVTVSVVCLHYARVLLRVRGLAV